MEENDRGRNQTSQDSEVHLCLLSGMNFIIDRIFWQGDFVYLTKVFWGDELSLSLKKGGEKNGSNSENAKAAEGYKIYKVFTAAAKAETAAQD